MLSLRTRVFAGAVLWTVGLVLLSFIGIGWVLRNDPDNPLLGRHAFIHIVWVSHSGPLLLVAAMAMAAGALHVHRGLGGIAQLRRKLEGIRDGRDPRLAGRYVPEVQPLVDDLNALLDHHERSVRRAIAKAGDLAHGLKTPLAILSGEADRQATVHPELAATLREQVERMRRQVLYHLVHARAAASGATPGASSDLRASVDRLARALAQIHRDRLLDIDVRVPAAHSVRVELQDLDEMVGNLLDNACKWARRSVVIDATDAAGVISLTVDDDGAGIPAHLREAVKQRGMRADEQAPGFGLGLSIVRELTELYGGSVALTDSPLGGLRATLKLPKL